MRTSAANIFGKRTRIDRANITYHGVKAGQGAQILRVPRGSVIKNLNLEGGASHTSPFACLRGAVLKFNPHRTCPVKIDAKGLRVPPGHTLMDYDSLKFTKANRNKGNPIPHQVIKTRNMKLYLVHASYCHPDQLFLPQGSFTQAEFIPRNVEGVSHKDMRDKALYLFENSLSLPDKSYNILANYHIIPQTIVVQLEDGGHIVLNR